MAYSPIRVLHFQWKHCNNEKAIIQGFNCSHLEVIQNKTIAECA